MAFESLSQIKPVVETLQGLINDKRSKTGHIHVNSWYSPSVCASELPVNEILDATIIVNDPTHDAYAYRTLVKLLLDRVATLGQFVLESSERSLDLAQTTHTLRRPKVGSVTFAAVLTQWSDVTTSLTTKLLTLQEKLKHLEAELEDVQVQKEAKDEEVETYRHILGQVDPHTGRDQRQDPPTSSLRAAQTARWEKLFKTIEASAEGRRLCQRHDVSVCRRGVVCDQSSQTTESASHTDDEERRYQRLQDPLAQLVALALSLSIFTATGKQPWEGGNPLACSSSQAEWLCWLASSLQSIDELVLSEQRAATVARQQKEEAELRVAQSDALVEAAREEVTSQAQAERVQLETKCDARVASIAAGFEAQLSAARATVDTLQVDLEQAQSREAEHLNECNRLKGIIASQQEALTERQETIAKHESKLNQAAEKLKSLKLVEKQLAKAKLALSKAEASGLQTDEALVASQAKNEQYEATIQGLNDDRALQESDLEQLRHRIEELECLLRDAHQHKLEALSQARDLESQLASARSANSLQNTVDQLEQQLASERADKATTVVKVNEQRKLLDNLQFQLADLLNLQPLNTTLSTENKQLHADNARLLHQLDMAKQELASRCDEPVNNLPEPPPANVAVQPPVSTVPKDTFVLKRPTRMWLTDDERASIQDAEHSVECACQQCRDAILLEDDPVEEGQWVTQAYTTPDATADVMAWLDSDDDTELDAAPPSRPETVTTRLPTAGRQRPSLSRPTNTTHRSRTQSKASGRTRSEAPPKPVPPSVATNPMAARRPTPIQRLIAAKKRGSTAFK
eukprot:m.25285 g.25285  ORF g.25285 m.25285 type:complete len:804 (+) comp11583_c0_seq1:85-2496(+)